MYLPIKCLGPDMKTNKQKTQTKQQTQTPQTQTHTHTQTQNSSQQNKVNQKTHNKKQI